MEKFKGFVASVTAVTEKGAFASVRSGRTETKVFIPSRFCSEALKCGDWVSTDGFIDPETKGMTAMNCCTVPQPSFEGSATVKFFNLEKGFGYVTLAFDDGQEDAHLSLDLVETAGWIPSAGHALKVTAVKNPRGWDVESFLLAEKDDVQTVSDAEEVETEVDEQAAAA